MTLDEEDILLIDNILTKQRTDLFIDLALLKTLDIYDKDDLRALDSARTLDSLRKRQTEFREDALKEIRDILNNNNNNKEKSKERKRKNEKRKSSRKKERE